MGLVFLILGFRYRKKRRSPFWNFWRSLFEVFFEFFFYFVCRVILSGSDMYYFYSCGFYGVIYDFVSLLSVFSIVSIVV